MTASRRKLLKYLAGGSLVIGAGSAGALAIEADEIRPYRRKTSISPVATRNAYLERQPPLNVRGAISTTLFESPDDVMSSTNQSELPTGLNERLVEGYDSGFWVAIVATLPLEANLQIGEVEFTKKQIRYADVSFEFERNTSEDLFYHYDFHHWKEMLPLTSEPKSVVVEREDE